MILTKEDCIKAEHPLFMSEGFCVLSTEVMKDEYKEAKFQLIECGGFAANPTTIAAYRGSGVFVNWCIDDDHSRYERCYILGIAKPETVATWLKLYGDKIHHWSEESTQDMKQRLEAYTKKTEQELIDKQNECWKKYEEIE